MQVPIPINNVYLECAFGESPSPKTEIYLSGSIPPARAEHEDFDIEILADAALDSNEKKFLRLKLYPKKEGTLKILGIRYLLCGIIPTYRAFQNVVKGSVVPLAITVTPPMPVLEIAFHGFPDEILAGQVTRATLELQNKGGKSLQSLFLKSSAPSFCYFGDGTSTKEVQYIEMLENAPSVSQQSLLMNNSLSRDSAVSLQLPKSGNLSSGTLEPLNTTLIPFWVRTDQTGRHIIRFLFVYQSSDPRDQLKFRTLRVTKTLDVASSLRVNAFTRPSFTEVNEFVLGLEITNIRSSFETIFRQITSASPSWSISRMSETDQITCKLNPNETKYLYLKVTKLDNKTEVPVLTTPEFQTTLAIERLVLAEAAQKMSTRDYLINLTSLASQGNCSDCITEPFQGFFSSARNSIRKETLHLLYPSFSSVQLAELFTLYWTDDIDLVFFYECPKTGAHGHLSISGLNLSLEPSLPLASWLSGIDSKVLAGRALFERTFQERKELINSLVSSKMSESSPVRVLVFHDSAIEIHSSRYFFCSLDAFL